MNDTAQKSARGALVPVCCLVMALGGMIAASDRRYRLKAGVREKDDRVVPGGEPA